MTNRGFDIEGYLVLMGVNILPFPKEELTAEGLVRLDASPFSLSQLTI